MNRSSVDPRQVIKIAVRVMCATSGIITSLCVLNIAATAQEVPLFKAETRLIEATISVHDASGGLVLDLAKEDLNVVEDGIPQTIRYFSRAEQMPLSIGLVIDSSGSQQKFLKAHERDLQEFLRQTMLPEDKAFAVAFGNHLRLVSDWSSDREAISAALHSYNKGKTDSAEIGPKEGRDLGTALNDAVFYSVIDKMTGIEHRRKVLVVFSDGEENSSEHDLVDTIEAAQGAAVLVYAIRYTETKHGEMNARDRYGVRELDHLTAQSGGKAYDSHAMNVSQAFAEIAGELRSLYGVGYQSTNKDHDGAFRKVVIRSQREGLVVRARAGYYAR